MKLCAEERPPRRLEQHSAVPARRIPRQRVERLGDALQIQFDVAVPAFEGRTRAVDTLQRPRVAVGPAQLPFDIARDCAIGSLEKLIEARDAKRARRLELREDIAQAREGGMGRVMIGADKERDMLSRRPLDQRGAHLPEIGQPRAGAG